MKPPFVSRTMPLGEYLGLPAINWSILSEFKRSPLHAHHAITHPRPPSKEMDLGSLAHAALLEPGRFVRDYACLEHWIAEGEEGQQAFAAFRHARDREVRARQDSLDRVTREGKALWAAFEAGNRGRTVVSVEDHASVRGMLAAIAAEPLALALLQGQGHSEVVGCWVDAETGEACKLRLDRLTRVEGYGSVLADLKTCGDATRFERDAANLGYHGQAAFYLDGWKALGYPEDRFFHVVVETEPPHGVRVLELQHRSIETGRNAWRTALLKYAECKRSGVWPGYPPGPEPVEIARWALDSPKSSEEW